MQTMIGTPEVPQPPTNKKTLRVVSKNGDLLDWSLMPDTREKLIERLNQFDHDFGEDGVQIYLVNANGEHIPAFPLSSSEGV